MAVAAKKPSSEPSYYRFSIPVRSPRRELIQQLLAEQFGWRSDCLAVFSALLDLDLSRLEDILLRTEFPLPRVREALSILIGAGYVTTLSVDHHSASVTMYVPLALEVELRVFLPQLLTFARAEIPGGDVLLGALAVQGRCRQDALVHMAARRPLDGISEPEGRAILQALAARRFIVQAEAADADAVAAARGTALALSTTDSRSERASRISTALAQHLTTAGAVVSDAPGVPRPAPGAPRAAAPDTTVWTIFWPKFLDIVRRDIVSDLLGRLYTVAAAQVGAALWMCGVNAGTSIYAYSGDSDARDVPLAAVLSKVSESLGADGTVNTQLCLNTLNYLASDTAAGVVTRRDERSNAGSSSMFRLVPSAAFRSQRDYVCRQYCRHTFGVAGARIYHHVSERAGMLLEQADVAAAALVAPEDGRRAIYRMTEAGVLVQQLVPKTAGVPAPNRSFHLVGRAPGAAEAVCSHMLQSIVRTRARFSELLQRQRDEDDAGAGAGEGLQRAIDVVSELLAGMLRALAVFYAGCEAEE